MRKPKDKNKKGFFAEFKEFINKGNAFMLAVGVVIGAAFSAIVNAFVNMLMSVATWGVPGGLKGLVTVLPAANPAQEGMDKAITVVGENGEVVASLGQKFQAAYLQKLAEASARATYTDAVVEANPNLVESVKTTILSKYDLHGTLYTYKMSAVIDWGALINAVLSFIIVAIVLFIIVKVVSTAQKKKEELKAKELEKYYEKHPEERPAPVEPGVPAPTQEELLTQIRDILKEKK